MKFREPSFPWRIGINGDLSSCNTLEDCVNNQIKFLVYSELLSIPAFPEMGVAPEKFGTAGDQYFAVDKAIQEHKISEAILNYVSPITDILTTLVWDSSGILRIDFYYTVMNGQKYQYSLNYYTPIEEQ